MTRWLFLGLVVLGCDTGEANESRRIPKLPPQAQSAVALAPIPVSVEGGTDTVVDTALLEKVPPDYSSEDRRAWRFSTLLGGVVGTGTVVAVTGARGIVLELPEPTPEAEPVLVVSRRGEVIAAVIEPKDPFPQYHGRGGRLGRRGDPLPRVDGVTKITVKRRL
jgi:hypothetical protein